ncbi:hypothetical protein COS86_08855 [Candidatus Bathyarchaeota archaeon CG07_land_8_20_14_0_80_47_9]|jgi:phage-related tail protein|nr:MAG: hypothetical protein COS86_08855 [Candidatus Bathyarchaeota archaeon CG07_land_8_20_14_0_80_47_9]
MNFYGIKLNSTSAYNTIKGNTLDHNTWAVWIDYNSNNNDIKANNFTRENGVCFEIQRSTGNMV